MMGAGTPASTISTKIKEDCYNKFIKDNGQTVRESTYQAHLSVKEYSQYSANPPPANVPDSQLGSVKERILVLCTKYSGRVLLQKGKLNESKNQYQIGRTWDLEELKAITKAGADGLILSLNKDYYWKYEEGPDRIERFVKFLTRSYGMYMGKYPVLNGWSIEEFDLPLTAVKKPFGVNASTQEVSYPQPDAQLMKSKSLKRKNLPNPVLPSLPQPRQTSQSSFQQTGQSNVSVEDLYKDIDFTANGKLPMKPMKVITRSADISQTSLPESTGTSREYLNQTSDSHYPQSSMNHPYQSVAPARSETEFTNDSQSFIFGPEDIAEELPKQRTSQRANSSAQSQQSGSRKVSEQFETNAALHMQLEERLRQPNGIFDSSQDYGIEESNFTDEEELGKPINAVILEEESLKDVSQSSNIDSRDMGAIDSSIQEIEDFMDSQLNFGSRNKSISKSIMSLRAPATQNNVIVIDSSEADVSDDRSFLATENDTSNTHDYTEFETETDAEADLNVSKKTGTLQQDRDPEIEEILDELQWEIEDDCNTLIKKLTGELNKLKYNNVKELVNLDFSGDSKKEDLKTSLDEIENINHIFRKMEINFKILAPEISTIENNSQGLQVKSVNKKSLFKDLKSILDKVSMSARDLSAIENFKEFDRINMLQTVESQILNLYNALETIRQDQTRDIDDSDRLDSMNALKQYLSNYGSVSNRFIKHFLDFFKKQFSFRMDQLNSLDRIYPKSLYVELNSLTIYSTFTFFTKEISPGDFNDLKLFVTSRLADFLEKLLKMRIKTIKFSDSHAKFDTANASVSSRLESSELGSLKKSRTLRLASRRDKLIGKLGFSEEDHLPKVSAPSSPKVETPASEANYSNSLVTSTGIEDTKTIVDIVSDAKEISIILTNFIGQVFHYESNIFNLNDFMKFNPLEKRVENLDKAPIEVQNNYTNDLVSVLNSIFGNYNNLFTKKIVPIEYNIPVILLYLESLSNESQKENLDYFVFNFLKKVLDKYRHSWTKFVKGHIDMVNKSSVSSKSGILPCIKNVNQFFHLTESALDHRSRVYGDLDDSDTKTILAQSYKEITEACIHLFVKDDPLLKNTEFDEKERNHRNVSIMQNIFSLSEQLVLFNNERTNKVKSKLDTVFKKVQETYFSKLLNQNIGKIVEFVNNFEALTDNNVKAKKYNKKTVKTILSGYTTKDLGNRAGEIRRKLEKHFISGNNMFEKDLLDRLWSDMEKQFIMYFFRLDNILSRNYSDIEYHISKQEIHSIFRSLNS
ncbi:hypothetical protein CANTEDRAFT_131909 [Yamadazyma tenuis ATCC 10573]|uniref:Exocyst complex component Sec3 PIP2-binding N-terminal domain-containing protein n=1 Tax=Candida tenuis (strain ATCC 10573 / BCRC 21748 / CBS 615 / JCM 9827 / NBRC 10315 / NRRL Y-1498 / VKM Y-70) TaxID=590646 RepID=G3BFC3_CANTC|nr:uncharacterized protein CANTEDRAFT_131909 [Yamadazyma tenuis ATCC 10573]EGV60022.1 hypothetical protein CANTEDRAFT_131909 [Yamadazyma tenuis ATCC 10573]